MAPDAAGKAKGYDPEVDGPLVYVALLSNKSEAPRAVKQLLAQLRYDMGSVPTEVVFTSHVDVSYHLPSGPRRPPST